MLRPTLDRNHPRSGWRRRKVHLAFALVAVATVALSACSAQTTSVPSSSAPTSGTLGAVLIGKNQYVQCLATGILEQLKGTHWKFSGQYSNFTPDGEISGFNTMVTQKVKGVMVLPVTSASAGRGALTTTNAKIPVVNLAWAAKSSADSLYSDRISVDDYTGGKMIAQWLGKNATPGKILVVEGQKGNESNDQLMQGLQDGVSALGGNWSIAGVAEGNYLRNDAITAAQDLMTAHPDSKIIVDFAAEMGDGIASLLEREGRKDIVHVTSDGNPEMVDWIKKGYITADRYYSSAEEGRIGARLMLDALSGKKSSHVTVVPSSMVTAKTIDATVKKTPLCYDAYQSQASNIP